jgi:hypothetical protein
MHLLSRAFADRLNVVLAALLLVVGTVLPAAAQPLSWSSDDVYVRIVDVGAGLWTVTVAPGDKVMVYDAGRWDNSFCSDAVRELVPESGDIDLLVLSHSDADHIGEVETILAERPVRLILRSGHVRETVTWGNANQAIADAVAQGASVINLRTMPIDPGTTFALGPAVVTFVAGWHEWPEPADLSLFERPNVSSIVVRLEFAGIAMLFTGDTVDRHIGDPPTACKDAEEAMVDNAERSSRRFTAPTVSIGTEHLHAYSHSRPKSSSCWCANSGPATSSSWTICPATRAQPSARPSRRPAPAWSSCRLTAQTSTPIKNAFAKLKALLRGAAERTVDALWATIGSLIDRFTPEECANYFAAARYDAT